MKKLLSLFLVLLVVTASLVACGGGGDTTDSTLDSSGGGTTDSGSGGNDVIINDITGSVIEIDPDFGELPKDDGNTQYDNVLDDNIYDYTN
ncbi:MAG: hypothetical protein J6B34_00180 [Clostridia bacterium]|nr:hypothetical protein [Clostridia bacterium]